MTAARQRLDFTGLSGFPPYGGDYSIIATCRSTGVHSVSWLDIAVRGVRVYLPSSMRPRSGSAPVSCAKARLTRRVLSSRRLSHIRQRAEFSLPCLGVYHWLSTQAPLTPARQDRSSYATFASARLRHGALALLGSIDCFARTLHPPSAPQCFVAGIPASRLATCLTAHPTNRVGACRSVRHSPPRPLPHLP